LRKLFTTALLTVITALGFASGAYCAVLDSKFLKNKIEKEITARLEQHREGIIEVKVESLPYEKVEVPDGNVEIKTEINNLNSISIVRVSIYVDKSKVKSFGVRAEIKIKDKVWVAHDWIKRGNSLTNLTKEKKDVSSVFNKLPGEGFIPGKYRARRNIRPGEIIELDNIEAIPTIVRNSPVSVIFKTPTVSITIPAVAVTSGKTGDYIKVKSKRYKKNYVGKIIGKNLVLVNI